MAFVPSQTFKESSLQLEKAVGTTALKHIQQHVRQEAAKPAKPAKEAGISGKRKSGIAVEAPVVSDTARCDSIRLQLLQPKSNKYSRIYRICNSRAFLSSIPCGMS